MLARQILKQGLLLKNAGAVSRVAAYHGGAHDPPTMNDLPLPAGDWKEYHSRQNSKYNAALIAGVLIFASTIGFIKSSGVVQFNYNRPKSLD